MGAWALETGIATGCSSAGKWALQECLELPCPCKGGERCPSGDSCHHLQRCLALRARSRYRRAQACRHSLCPWDSLEEQSRCREFAQVSSVLEELSFSVLLFFLGVCDCGEHPENCH